MPPQTPVDDFLYWKNRSLSLEKELNDTRLTLDEFQASSKELEEELERELHTLEVQNTKLKNQNQSLTLELDTLKQKYQTTCLNSNRNALSLQTELETLREKYDKMQRKAVGLEMDNEELESFKRATHSSILDIEKKNSEIQEWKGRYEFESKQRNQLKVELQRLKDELQDLENELYAVRSNSPTSLVLNRTSFNSSKTPTLCKEMLTEEKAFNSRSHILSPTTSSPLPTTRKFSVYHNKGGSSGNIIQDITERAKVLEIRLISCRSIVKPLLPNMQANQSNHVTIN